MDFDNWSSTSLIPGDDDDDDVASLDVALTVSRYLEG